MDKHPKSGNGDATEALKEYVKNYNSAIAMLAEYGSNLIKAWSSSVFKMQ
jgi:negative regulator of genetic competence, sporulation and motility